MKEEREKLAERTDLRSEFFYQSPDFPVKQEWRVWFGVCPECLDNDGYLHLGPEAYAVCHEHEAKWPLGKILTAEWEKTSDRQFVAYQILLDTYKVIEPVSWYSPFGVCPKCFFVGECLHVGKSAWYCCPCCGVKWFVGENVFSDWRDMTDEEFKENSELLETYEIVEPVHGEKDAPKEKEDTL